MLIFVVTTSLLLCVSHSVESVDGKECGSLEEFRHCVGCDVTCKSLHLRDSPACVDQCQTGCRCLSHHVRDFDGNCISRQACFAKAECNDFEEFKICSTCEHNCSDLLSDEVTTCSESDPCKKPSCQCLSGYVRGENNRCISREQCLRKLSECGPFEQFKICSGCENTCANLRRGELGPCVATAFCMKPSCQCEDGFARDENDRCVFNRECCGENLHYRECGTCQETCEGLRNGERLICTKECKPATCHCNEGFVRDKDRNCVPRANCQPKCKFPELPSSCADQPGCGNTCDNLIPGGDPPTQCKFPCQPGCTCITGYTRFGETCVRKADCKGLICSLPSESGPCEAKIPSWFYNRKANKCEQFFYGGCGGNGNRFETEDQCNGVCEPTRMKICTAEPETGPCAAAFQRYYYNGTTQKCLTFTWGGCGGNGNNFVTEKACLKTCGRENECPADENFQTCSKCEETCGDAINDIKPVCTLECKPPGCRCRKGFARNSGDRCILRNECKNTCHLPADHGPCDAAIPRWFYDSAKGSCAEFTYGGCEGNRNNFETEDQCIDDCGKKPCLQPVDPGPCKGKIKHWYYNKVTGKCTEFFYGGCKGNDNLFITEEECEKKCEGRRCFLPADPGTCEEAAIRSFFYNPTSKQCEEFLYGGCEGNANRFETQTECLNSCDEE